MMTIVTTLVNVKIPAWIAVVLVVGGLIWHTSSVLQMDGQLEAQKGVIEAQSAQLLEQAGRIEELKSALDEAIHTNEKLAASVETQNEQVKVLQAEADLRGKAAQTALDQAKKEGEQWRSRYAQVLEAPLPKGQDECAALKERLGQYVRLRKRP